MALTTCKECGHKVSTDAEHCPGCGIKNPVAVNSGVVRILGGALGGAFALLIVVSLISQCSSSSKELNDAACKAELKCWAEKSIVDAGIDCKRHIEKLSPYSSRWSTEKSFERFSRYGWLNKEKATLTFVGDKIEFQNGFGAFQPHVYECNYDPISKAVVDVRAWPGRL